MIEIYLSYGNFPIHNIKILGDKIIYKNTINGSRDGGLKYAENFFEEKEISLDSVQKSRMDAIVESLELEEVLNDKPAFYPGKTLRDRFQLRKFENWYDIKNPEKLVAFCEELCDFIPYENNAFDNQDDSEYAFVDPNITIIPYGDTICLTDETIGKEIKIKKAEFDFGRDSVCALRLEKSVISRRHATFFYEKNNWFIRDNNSTNGTRINGVRITPKKKYQLLADDVIEFADTYKYVFYKTMEKKENFDENNQTEQADYMDDATKIKFLEALIEFFDVSGYTDTETLKSILIVLSEVPVYFPVEIDFESLFGNINPMELKEGDTLQPQSAVKMKFCTLVPDDKDKDEVIPMFTSKSRINNPEGISIVRYYPQDYLPILIQMDKNVIINPFSEYRFLLTKELMRDALWPFVQRNTEKFI